MELTYRIMGGDGQEYGPASLAQIQAWIQEGRISASSQLRRSDQSAWQPASAFPELGLSGSGAAAALPQASPPPGLAASAANLGLLQWEAQLKAGASWFYWIAGLSAVNSILALSGAGVSFLFGLGITWFINGAAASSHSSGPVVVVAAVLDFLVAGVFALFGLFANKKHAWSFIVGMVLYGLDGLIFLLFQSWLSLGFHVFALVCIYKGFSALRKLKRAGS